MTCLLGSISCEFILMIYLSKWKIYVENLVSHILNIDIHFVHRRRFTQRNGLTNTWWDMCTDSTYSSSLECSMLEEKGTYQLYSEAGVTIVEGNDLAALQWSQVTCNIYIEDVSADANTTMDCGHCFCNNCKRSPIYLF